MMDFFVLLMPHPVPAGDLINSSRICDAMANSSMIPIDGRPLAFQSSSKHLREPLPATSIVYACDCHKVGGDCRCFLIRAGMAVRAALHRINTEVARGETSLGLHIERKSIVADETSGTVRKPNSRSTSPKYSGSIVANNS